MISESGFARAAAVVIPLQSARITGQLAAGDALDVKALGVLAGDTAGIILALSSPGVLGPYWLVLLAFFVGSLFVSVAVVLPTRFNPGPPAADDDIAAVIRAGELRAYELLFNGMSEAVRHNAGVLRTKRRTLLVAFTLALEPILILLGIAALALVHIPL